MKTGAKEVAIIGTFLALMLASQFALSWVSGVEIITVLFITFCYCFGIRRGLVLACSFSALRCVIFGFFPAVVILYFIYYNLLALIFGAVGNAFNRKFSVKILIVLVALALVLTAVFTLLDNFITPVFYKFNETTAKTYFIASLPTLFTQLICVAVSVSALFYPLYHTLMSLKK